MSDTAANKEKLLRETVAMLRAVLISASCGVRFEKLLHDYKKLTFKTIPFVELGYPRLEVFLQSIPDVARVERGPHGEWIVKGVASDADKHVGKLISKQNKPRVRKSAKSMISRRKVAPLLPKVNIPVRKTFTKPLPPGGAKYEHPPRVQRVPEMKNQTKGKSGSQPGKVKASTTVKNHLISVGRGELFNKAIQGIKTSRSNRAQHHQSGSSNFKVKDIPALSVSISNKSQERNVTTIVPASPERLAPSGVLDDIACVKSELSKALSGFLDTRLEHLYKEKFKKVLPHCVITEELKFRPDIAHLEEPIPGKFLLYAPQKQQNSKF